ncbi:MAG TPA: hypothetical protein VHX20_02130 [Terracidiphilus sp.]|nr:hypothetical protein [Terracidiphilus sp.]
MPELGRRVVDARRAIGFSLQQHPIACLGQMAGNGDDGAAVALAGCETLIKQTDVAFALRAQMGGAIGGFDEGPLEVTVDIAADAAVVCVSSVSR